MNYSNELSKAIQHFWQVRQNQLKLQGSATGRKDTGNRGAVTGGAQLDGFAELLGSIIKSAGLPDHSIFTKETTLPGYFRPSKNWDLVVVADGELLAAVEFKSHVGPSFSNNFNNRVEEALGSATDIWKAYRAGAFKPSHKPWLGWLMLLEDAPKSQSPVRVFEPHFDVFPEFKEASYADRYELFCKRLVRERIYDASCLILTDREQGLDGQYTEPNAEINFKNFAISLISRIMAFVLLRKMK